MSDDTERFWALVEALVCEYRMSETEAQARAAEAMHPEDARQWRAEHGEMSP